MHGIPPTTESLSPISVYETFVRILNEKEPQALRTLSGRGMCYGRNSNIPLRPRANRRAQTSSADPNRLALNGLASLTSTAKLDGAGIALHVMRLSESLRAVLFRGPTACATR
jgi:hypothetical protein